MNATQEAPAAWNTGRNADGPPVLAAVERYYHLNESTIAHITGVHHEGATGHMRHVCSCRFGPARDAAVGSYQWSGDSYRFDLYCYGCYTGACFDGMALRYAHGGGCGWLEANAHGGAMLKAIAAIPDEFARWDICAGLYHVHRNRYESGRADKWLEVCRAFVAGLLCKRKQRGKSSYVVWIKPTPTPS